MADVQNFFEYAAFVGNSAIEIYDKKIENRVTFKVESECVLELFTPEKVMKLLGNTEKR